MQYQSVIIEHNRVLIQLSERNKWFERNRMGFAIFTSVLISLTIITAIYWHSRDWTAAGTVALACFGAVGMVFSYISTIELKRDRIPYVHVNFTLYEEKEHLVYVVVQNSGNAPAHDINISVLPLEGEEELLESGAIFSNFNNLSIIKYPIQFLPPNDSRRTLFGTVAGMGERESEIEYEVNITYKDSSGHVYNSYMVLEANHLMGNKYFRSKDPTVEVLDDIRKELNDLKDIVGNILQSQDPTGETESTKNLFSGEIDESDGRSD